jgi:hypothetical protein
MIRVVATLARRFAVFAPDGTPIIAGVGLWTDRDRARTWAGTMYGHDGSWAAAQGDGYAIRQVAIVDDEDTPPEATPDRRAAMIHAARAVLLGGCDDDEALALAICTVERLDPDPHMLRLAAQAKGLVDPQPGGAPCG